MQKQVYFYKSLLTAICLYMAWATAEAYTGTIKHLDVKDGLSNNLVRAIAQDGDGYIWIGTEVGLNRFDGHSFRTYNIRNSPLRSNAVTSLLYDDADNKLYIGTRRAVEVLDLTEMKFERIEAIDTLKINLNINAICASGNDGIWIAARYGTLMYYDKRRGDVKIYDDKTLPGLPINFAALLDDGKGKLYIGHLWEGMSVLDKNTGELVRYVADSSRDTSIADNGVLSIVKDRFENIWVGTTNGLSLFNRSTGTFRTFRNSSRNDKLLASSKINHLAVMDDNTLWLACEMGGISILDLESLALNNPDNIEFASVQVTYDETGLSSPGVHRIFQDSYGNVWIGSLNTGLDFISRSTLPFNMLPYAFANKKRMVNRPVHSMVVLPGDRRSVWVGSENEIALFVDENFVRSVNLSRYVSRPYAQVFSMGGDENEMLLGLDDGTLLLYNPKSGRISKVDAGNLQLPVINGIVRCDDGTYCLAGSSGLFTYCNGKVHECNYINEKMQHVTLTDLTFDKDKNMWISTYGAGVFVIGPDKEIKAHFELAEGLSHNVVNNIYTDSEGRVWAATQDGAVRFDNADGTGLVTVGYEHGLANTNIHSVTEDKQGNLWFVSDVGISRMSSDLTDCRNYDIHDGIMPGRFSNTPVAVTGDGRMYICGFQGVCTFSPSDLDAVEAVSPVSILGYKVLSDYVDGAETPDFNILSGDGIKLPYDKNSFSISFSVPDYSQYNMVEYAYKMVGYDDRWINVGGNHTVVFRNIPPGDYRFMVKARLRHQEWDEPNVASIEMQVTPPLWLTWYAKLFYGLIAAAVIYMIAHFYTRHVVMKNSVEAARMKSQNEQELINERLRFYTNITHELRTPLTLIIGPLEDMIEDKKLPAVYKKRVKLIYSSAVRLLNLVNEILEFRKTETQNRKLAVERGSLAGVVKEIGLRYKELNHNPDVKYVIDVPDKTGNDMYFDSEVVTTILNNLLSNAVKYTPKGHISLSLREEMEDGVTYADIIVSDSGHGISVEALPHIFTRYYQAEGKHQVPGTGIGLALAKSLAELHGGELTVHSVLGEGATFRFRIRKDNPYPDALRKEPKPVEPEADEEQAEETAGKVCTDKRPLVLIVEDNDEVRQYMEDTFSEYYRIATAHDGKDGIAKARTLIPDIIISDIMMPEIDGLEMCRIVKEDMLTCHIPVILLTAKDSTKDKEEGYDKGADSYLTKPFSAKLLLRRVENLLESRRRLAGRVKETVPDIAGDSPVVKTRDGLKLSRLDQQFLERIETIIEEHVNNPDLDVAFLTEQLNMSNSTLYRKIKAVVGMSANELIRKIRLRHSVRLMMEDGMNVSDAAYASGFNTVDYFRACFKDEYGTTPSDYIKKHKI